MSDIMRVINSSFIKSACYPCDFPDITNLEIAFVGKSNVGKSSLINTILNRRNLVKTSVKPGKTRLINFFGVSCLGADKKKIDLTFVDLPGYGYANVPDNLKNSWKKMIERYFFKRKQLKAVVLLVDIRHKCDPKDQIMQEMLEQMNIPYLLVGTKADKIAKNKIKAIVKKKFTKKVMPFSALKKTGIQGVLDWIESLQNQ